MVDYFGAWPAWFPIFLESCKFNSTVNWIIRTDCEIPLDCPENVRFIPTRYIDYIENISNCLDIDFRPSSSYKICDVRPMLGDIYFKDIKDFDFYGFGDIDVIYGDIRKFYTDDVLTHDVISSHEGMLSGHFCLFRNTEATRTAYKKIPGWKAYLENPESTRFDEDIFSRIFFEQNDLSDPSHFRVRDIEQYSTVFHPREWHDGQSQHPDIWFWNNGLISNNRNIGRDYLYLHLMNFQSLRWATAECYKTCVAWKDNPHVQFSFTHEGMHGVQIDWTGIHSLTQNLTDSAL